MAASNKAVKSGQQTVPLRRRYFARRAVRPWERPGIMRKHIYTGAMGSMYFTLMVGFFFAYLAGQMGMAKEHFALMGGVSSLLLSFQLLSALITQKGRRRKRIWFWYALFHRSVRIIGICTAFILWCYGLRGPAFVIMGTTWISTGLSAMAMPPWMSWLGDIIPEEEHGAFWGRRDQWIALSTLVALLAAATVMDAVSPDRKPLAAFFILLTGGVIGLLDIVIHGTIPEPHIGKVRHGHFLDQILEPLRDRRFRPWLVMNAAWTFSVMLGGVVWSIFVVGDLGIEHNFKGGVLVTTGITSLFVMLAAGRIGKLVDRWGPQRVLYWGYLLWAFIPVLTVLASKETALIYLALISILSGVGVRGVMNASTKLIVRFPPRGHRAMYVAVSSCVGSFAGGLGGLTAWGVLWLLSDEWRYTLWGKTLTAAHVVFLGSVVLRMSCALFLTRRINNPAGHKSS